MMMMARCKEQRAGDLPDGRVLKNPVQYRQQKYFASPFGRNSFIDSNRPTPLQGRIAIVERCTVLEPKSQGETVFPLSTS
jgi:hypothetical protein